MEKSDPGKYETRQCINPSCKQGDKNQPKYFKILKKSTQYYCSQECLSEHTYFLKRERVAAERVPEVSDLPDENPKSINIKLAGLDTVIELTQICATCFTTQYPKVKISRGLKDKMEVGAYYGKCPICGKIAERDVTPSNLVYVFRPTKRTDGKEFTENQLLAFRNAYFEIIKKYGL